MSPATSKPTAIPHRKNMRKAKDSSSSSSSSTSSGIKNNPSTWEEALNEAMDIEEKGKININRNFQIE